MSDTAPVLDEEVIPESPGEQANAEGDFDKAMAELDQLSSVSGTRSGPSSSAGRSSADGSDFVWDIPVDVQVVVGRAELSVASLMKLEAGEVLALDRRLEEPVDIVVNGRLVGKGEITVLEGESRRFGIKVLSLTGH